MTAPFVITIDATEADAWFGRLLERGQRLDGLMRDVGAILTRSTQRRFDAGVGPDGVAWVPLKDGSGRTPLKKTRHMRDGIVPASGEDWVEIRATAKQAAWHQFGTDPYVILAKPGKALSWPGLPPRTTRTGKTVPGAVKKVNHPGLPARPFIGLSEDDKEQIGNTAAAWVSLRGSGSNMPARGRSAGMESAGWFER